VWGQGREYSFLDLITGKNCGFHSANRSFDQHAGWRSRDEEQVASLGVDQDFKPTI
jgi:hypothetical protein